MKDSYLRFISLLMAAFAGVIALASIVFYPARLIVFPATILVGGNAVLLFLKTVFSPTYQRGLNAAKRGVPMRNPWRVQAPKLGDRDWGLFGRRVGSPALLWLRAIFVVGILPVALLSSWIGADVVGLWVAGVFVSMQLSLMHAALSRPEPPNGRQD